MLSGPYGTMILADLGAETIKIEPMRGEGTRGLLANDPDNSLDGMGAYFITLNRNKKSVCVDLKTTEGLELFYEIIRSVDIVVDNFSADVTRKLNIDFDHLSVHNPAIITCSVTGFGSSGPHYKRPAFDQVVQAMGGGMSITGTDPEHPTRAGIPIGDLGGGMFAVMGVLAALYERERSGKGQHVDISMLDCQLSMLNYMVTMYFLSGKDPYPIGNSHFVHVPYNTFRTADGFVVIAVIFDSFWVNLVDMLDCDELRKPEYLLQPGRLADKVFIEAKINELFATNTSAHWIAQLEAKRIPCAPVNKFSEALVDEQALHRNMVIELQHPGGKTTHGPGNPIKLSRTDTESFTPAPLLGQDTDDVLRDTFGLDEARIQALRQAGVVN
jgi:crotonobetainyl-CoA:carnitine CoA-transferase CaiB-like acyl-CoA transferase